MYPLLWHPPVALSPAEQRVYAHIKYAKLFRFLRDHRLTLFSDEFQAEFAVLYTDSRFGQPPVPPAQLALALILQSYTGYSDDAVIEALLMDRRWQLESLHNSEKSWYNRVMIARYTSLHRHPTAFRSLTGVALAEFADLVTEITPDYEAAETTRHTRPERSRAIGGGHPFALDARDQLLLTLIWLRQYPTHEVLGWLFGVSDSTATRVIARCLPLLAAAGVATHVLPRAERPPARSRDALLAAVPALLVLVDSFEQRVQRPKTRSEADTWYSGKKKQHTIKSQIAIDEDSGQIVDVGPSVRGPTADITLLKESGVAERVPEGVGIGGDLAYIGVADLHPAGLGATPRKKPRGKERPAEDRAYNTAFARRRIGVEHTIGRLRRFEALTRPDRQHRTQHQERVQAVSGLVNRQIARRRAAAGHACAA